MRKEPLCILLVICGMFFAITGTALAADEVKIIHDPVDDVIYYTMLNENETITNEKPNVDITEVQYSRTGQSAIVTLTVKGVIENRGSIDGNDLVDYFIVVATNDHEYGITYYNKTCILSVDLSDSQNITDFTVSGSTLTVPFQLLTSGETYNSTYAVTGDINSLTGEAYTDDANDLPLQIVLDGPFEGIVGDEIDFLGYVAGGTQPYTYSWNFGDGSTISTEEEPLHSYTASGNYTVTFSVTDDNGVTEVTTSFALITSSNPPPNGGDTGGISNLWLFVILVVIIVIAGVGVIVYLIRR